MFHQDTINSTRTTLDYCYCLTEIIGQSLNSPDLVRVEVKQAPALPSVTVEKKFDRPIATRYGETEPSLNTIQFTIGQNKDWKGIAQGKNNALITFQFNKDYELPQHQDGLSTKIKFYGNYLSGSTPLNHYEYFYDGKNREQRHYLDITTRRDLREKFTHCSIPNCVCLLFPQE